MRFGLGTLLFCCLTFSAVLRANEADPEKLPAPIQASRSSPEEGSHAQPMMKNLKGGIEVEGMMKRSALVLSVLGILFVLFTMSLQLSCWFSLVETTFKRCAYLTVVLMIPTCLAMGASVWLFVTRLPESLLLMLGAWVLCVLVCGYWTRRILQCKWRSVVTIFVMYNLSAYIMTAVAALFGALIVLGYSGLSSI